MNFIDRFVHRNEQVRRKGPLTQAGSGIGQAVGEERLRLIDQCNQLVTGEAFTPPSFIQFSKTMRKLVGTQPEGFSNALPYPLEDFSKSGYVEFWNSGLSVIQEQSDSHRSWSERAIHLKATPMLDGVYLQLPWPKGSELHYLQKLLELGVVMTFQVIPTTSGKGAFQTATMPLSDGVARRFCGKIVDRLSSLPANYIFQPMNT